MDKKQKIPRKPISLKEAVNILLKNATKIEDTECISLWDANGRILAEDITARRNQPPFSRSPLDGYALRSEDILKASKEASVSLKVIDEIAAGDVSEKSVHPGEAIRIMTGAKIPSGADCVIRQEDTDYGEDMVSIYKAVGPYENYCFAGEDYKAGTRLMNKGLLLGAVEIGILASLGLEKVLVFRIPKVALITTGDEVVLPGEPLSEGKIYDSNLYALGSRLKAWGMDLVWMGKINDEADSVADKIKYAMEEADLVITTGGVSVGKKDIMHEATATLGCERLFWGISMKPGMPTLCTKYGSKLIISLSGNPYGAIVNMELLVGPVLAAMSGRYDLEVKKRTAVLNGRFDKKCTVVRYVRAHEENGLVYAQMESNGSGIISSMCGCNCLIEVPAGTEKVVNHSKVEVVML